ncbi:MAG: F0F1 ATP synthase subunit A [Pseudomonadota bacterium]
MADPLHQFVVKPIVPLEIAGLDLSFTNSALWMVITVVAAYALLHFGTRHAALVPGRLQSVVETAYEFIADLVRENAGRDGLRFFPFIFTLFMFILLGNMLGMIPGSFTFTSHIIVTFFMAICVFIGVTIVGFVTHGAKFLTFFVPQGAPTALLPLLVPIEVISYFVRPISLSVRLFVNMMAGHTMLKVFAGFTVALGVFGVAPLLVATAITGLEFVIAFLQAFVFTVLTCLYLHDALYMH